MLAIFLAMVGHGHCNRVLQELFQHSGETISRLIHKVLKIREDPRYYPYFANAIGAIDGTHIPCVVHHSNCTGSLIQQIM